MLAEATAAVTAAVFTSHIKMKEAKQRDVTFASFLGNFKVSWECGAFQFWANLYFAFQFTPNELFECLNRLP